MSQRIEDYAVIGDLHTAALVGMDGSIDWLCLPHFDSASCFARLLGSERTRVLAARSAGGAGSWPRGAGTGPTRSCSRPSSTRRRAPCASPTACRSARGTPTWCGPCEGVSGTVDMHMELAVRFDYGEVVPWVTSHDGLIRLTAGPDSVALWHQVQTTRQGHAHRGRLHRDGERALSLHAGLVPVPRRAAPAVRQLLRRRISPRRAGASGPPSARTTGPYRDAVVRSLITLKALTYEPTGGIVAAPTTSLPETLGGQPQLGLPLLLAARRHAHPGVAHARRLPRRRPWPGATGCCGPWPATSRSCRSCTGPAASAGSTSGRSTGCPATRAPNPCASATPPRGSSSSTSTARSCPRSTPRLAARACTAERPGSSRCS